MIQLRHITKSYEGKPLLSGIGFTIQSSEIVCLLGPSGGGKTTLLRIIAGLEKPDTGEILFDGVDIGNVPAHKRGLGFMFQDLALFPHKNVFENIAFGINTENELEVEVAQLLKLVGLPGFEKRNVNTLSGGEQQRVALARSLAPHPRLLMLDEPLGALDRILREQLVSDLRAILKRIKMTALYVTHDQDEAFAIADRIVIIHDGHVAQIGTPEEIYRTPANAFVAQFLGLTNLFDGNAHDGQVATPLGIFEDAKRNQGRVVVLIRSDQVKINDTGDGIDARVEECVFRAGKYRVRMVTDSGARLVCESERAFEMDAQIQLKIESIQVLG